MDAALPDDWPSLERALTAASALAGRSARGGAGLLAVGLDRSLDAAQQSLSPRAGAAPRDEDEAAWAQVRLVKNFAGVQVEGAAISV